MKARSEAAFNIYREIAYQTNLMFTEKYKDNIQHFKFCANAIAGHSKAARQEIVAFCKHQLNGSEPEERDLKGVDTEESNEALQRTH